MGETKQRYSYQWLRGCVGGESVPPTQSARDGGTRSTMRSPTGTGKYRYFITPGVGVTRDALCSGGPHQVSKHHNTINNNLTKQANDTCRIWQELRGWHFEALTHRSVHICISMPNASGHATSCFDVIRLRWCPSVNIMPKANIRVWAADNLCKGYEETPYAVIDCIQIAQV